LRPRVDYDNGVQVTPRASASALSNAKWRSWNVSPFAARCPGIDHRACLLLFHRAADHHVISDYRNFHAEVRALRPVGLLDPANGGVRADCDVIETKIAI
jgi:hypothetical protein